MNIGDQPWNSDRSEPAHGAVIDVFDGSLMTQPRATPAASSQASNSPRRRIRSRHPIVLRGVPPVHQCPMPHRRVLRGSLIGEAQPDDPRQDCRLRAFHDNIADAAGAEHAGAAQRVGWAFGLGGTRQVFRHSRYVRHRLFGRQSFFDCGRRVNEQPRQEG